MDPLIASYIDTTFNPDLRLEVERAMQLCMEVYEQYDDTAFIDLLSLEHSLDQGSLQDRFLHTLHDKLNYIFKAHHIVLTSDATILDKNELLEALLTVQQLNEYDEVLNILDDVEGDDEERLSRLLGLHCTLSESRIIELIESVEPALLPMIRIMAYDLTELNAEGPKPLDPLRLERLKEYASFLGDDTAIGLLLVKANMPVGLDLTAYLPFVKEVFEDLTDASQVAKDIYSMLLLGKDTYQEPMLAWRNNSQYFSTDIQTTTKIDTALLGLLNTLNQFRATGKVKK